MVGVPRSKGCKTCVQRRIKCDQTRPNCERCVKRGLECPGYGVTVKFQDEGPRLKQHFDKKQPAFTVDVVEDEVTFTSNPYSSGSSTSLSSPNGSLELVRQDLAGDQSPSDGLSDPFIPVLDFLRSPGIFQDQLLGIFIGAVAPNVRHNIPPSHRFHGNWLNTLMAMPSEAVPDGLSSAIRALSLSYIGKANHLEPFLEESRHYYGLALKQLSQAIRASPDVDALSSTTLSTTMLLSFYEMFQPAGSNSWIRHAGGAGALIKARGPALSTATHFDRVMFLAYRNALLISAFENCTACFIAEPAWAEVSRNVALAEADDWEFSELTEDHFAEMAQLPGVICDARILGDFADDPSNSAELVADMRTGVLSRALRHRIQLQGLFAMLQDRMKELGVQPFARAAINPNESLFPNQVHYENIFQSSLHCGFYTCSIILNVTIVELYKGAAIDKRKGQQGMWELKLADLRRPTGGRRPPPSGSSSDTTQTIPLFYRQSMSRSISSSDDDSTPVNLPTTSALLAENIQFATHICRSADYMSNSAFIGRFFITFGLRVSLLAFPGDRERNWVRSKLAEIGEILGMAADMQQANDLAEELVDLDMD